MLDLSRFESAEPDCDYDVKQWLSVVRSVEDLGYDLLLVTDHLRLRVAALPALAMAAGVSSRLRLGTCGLSTELRKPRKSGESGRPPRSGMYCRP